MKKLIVVALLALGAIYGVGFITLGESGANRFLNHMEDLTGQGKAQELCDLMTDDLVVDVLDHTAGRNGKIKGGKTELCALYTATAPAMALLQASTQIQRRDLKVKREWLHPWTAQVTFTEFRTTSIPRAGLNIATESDDEYELIRTLSGTKVRRLKSEVFAQEE